MAKEKGIFPPQRDHARGVTTSIGIIIIIAVAVVAFGGVFGYQYLVEKSEILNSKSETNSNSQNPNSQNVVGGDRDAHGCIGSAGYTWCEAKQKCLRPWEEPCEVNTTAGWINCNNEKYGFTIKLPPSLFEGCFTQEQDFSEEGKEDLYPWFESRIDFFRVKVAPDTFGIFITSQQIDLRNSSEKFLGQKGSKYFYIDASGCCAEGNSVEVRDLILNKIAPTFKFIK